MRGGSRIHARHPLRLGTGSGGVPNLAVHGPEHQVDAALASRALRSLRNRSGRLRPGLPRRSLLASGQAAAAEGPSVDPSGPRAGTEWPTDAPVTAGQHLHEPLAPSLQASLPRVPRAGSASRSRSTTNEVGRVDVHALRASEVREVARGRGTSGGDAAGPVPRARRGGASSPSADTSGAPGRRDAGALRRGSDAGRERAPCAESARQLRGGTSPPAQLQDSWRRPTSIPAAAHAWRNVSKCRSTA